MANFYEITLALAGVCQSAKLVQELAITGLADENSFNTSICTLLQTAPKDVLDVYGGQESNLTLGLKTLINQLNGNDVDLNQYWLNILALENKLNKNCKAKAILAHRIRHLPIQSYHNESFDSEFIAKLADIYVDIISPLGNKIQVKGSPKYLQQISMHHRIRACLLSGIRSAVLWRQVGGTKWQILFSRGKLINTAQKIHSTF
ncbi:high frequency lysogenization protein HflD [Seminibacterium arietis]|uniref:High frequency lysogenization protein HflD homolog n=1 Tax=Seminibacterium arietis TaxID=1173502 RepID=A0ABW3I9F9_9PAST